jgi:uncharacterized membrane protein
MDKASNYIKGFIGAYLFIISTVGSGISVYLFTENAFYPFLAIVLNMVLFYTHDTLWNKAVIEEKEETEQIKLKQEPIKVIGTRTVNYYEEVQDIPTIDHDRPFKFNLAKTYYEPKKPV